MADPLIDVFKSALPDEIKAQIASYVQSVQQGHFKHLLDHKLAQLLLGWRDNDSLKHIQCHDGDQWNDWIFRRLGVLASPADGDAPFNQHFFFLVGLACLQAFVQSNVTGPPLHFRALDVLWPDYLRNSRSVSDERQALVDSLNIDGIAAYRLTPNIELFCLADTIFTCPPIRKNIVSSAWVRLRLDFLHQRLLAETSSTLQGMIYDNLKLIEDLVQASPLAQEATPPFLIERASVHTHHGFDKLAREDLDSATRQRDFAFALTGKLGKRTRFQERDISQLVVLARSHDGVDPSPTGPQDVQSHDTQPQILDLNDDTLLESISFTGAKTSSTDVKAEENLPVQLKSLEPGDQPKLQPLDSVILLQLASSISNTSPADGLTREETLPYALRVLEGGSSNWQVYTQALLVRSRIEGYKSRTMERGLLQLQALVDQVIADTIPETPTGLTPSIDKMQATSTFLPRAKESEAAPAKERLEYVYALASPTRRELEAELAQRWVTMGGLRSALEIYERLEMWAEAALCWAATDREDKAKAIIRRQLNYQTTGPNTPFNPDTETWQGPPRDPVPADAPRLYCILGDIDKDADAYEQAWIVSGKRYARAQRSLGRLYWTARDFTRSADAYTAALALSRLHGPSWFALGCALLELSEFERAAEAFARVVQLDDADAEAWSNLAVALLKRGPATDAGAVSVQQRSGDEDDEADRNGDGDGDGDGDDNTSAQQQQSSRDPSQTHKRDALRAFKRAATLKYESRQIWDNVLTVSLSLAPPSYADAAAAQTRLLDIAGRSAGEDAVDADALDALVAHVVATLPPPDASTRPGSLAAAVARLVTARVAPLITRSARLWRAVGRVQLWQGKPAAALDAHEKAWRAATGAGAATGDWEHGDAAAWRAVVDATEALVAAYESLGIQEREGLASGSGALVARDWRFKARSAVRGVMGRGRACWGEDGGGEDEGWARLAALLEDLKASS